MNNTYITREFGDYEREGQEYQLVMDGVKVAMENGNMYLVISDLCEESRERLYEEGIEFIQTPTGALVAFLHEIDIKTELPDIMKECYKVLGTNLEKELIA